MRAIIILFILLFLSGVAYAECDCENPQACQWGRFGNFTGSPDDEFYGYIQIMREAESMWGKANPDDIIKKYKEAIEIEDCLPDPYMRIATIYYNKDQEFLMLEYFRKACNRSHNAPRLHDQPCTNYHSFRKKILGY